MSTKLDIEAIRKRLATPIPCSGGCSAPATHEWYDGDYDFLVCDSCAEEHECTDDDRLHEYQTPEREDIAALLAEVARLTAENERLAGERADTLTFLRGEAARFMGNGMPDRADLLCGAADCLEDGEHREGGQT